ncbi:MAG: 3-methyl-2-oxobutanoate hydroxymethyltransferase [Deltaproteobacteria bacterium]|nr:3-methyl-2-oxobutanoate hydroxymethyltransferase [Deltaproteobacteria bacterium]
MSSHVATKQVTVPWIRSQKGKEKLTMLTAYDYPTALFLDEAGVDMLLVGDSVATVMYGEPNTLAVTMDDMLRHTRAVARAAKRALVIGDMPFMSYQVSREQAVTNAGRFLKEAGAQAVKLEGGTEVAETIKAITTAGIPVCAHIGLTPQSINAMGTYRMHGKTNEERQYLLDSAYAAAAAGAFAVVLECVEANLATEITKAIKIPTVGIGAGTNCDAQVLVINDLVGLTAGRVPKFVAPLANLKEPLQEAVKSFIARTRQAAPPVEVQEAVAPPTPTLPTDGGKAHAVSH